MYAGGKNRYQTNIIIFSHKLNRKFSRKVSRSMWTDPNIEPFSSRSMVSMITLVVRLWLPIQLWMWFEIWWMTFPTPSLKQPINTPWSIDLCSASKLNWNASHTLTWYSKWKSIHSKLSCTTLGIRLNWKDLFFCFDRYNLLDFPYGNVLCEARHVVCWNLKNFAHSWSTDHLFHGGLVDATIWQTPRLSYLLCVGTFSVWNSKNICF